MKLVRHSILICVVMSMSVQSAANHALELSVDADGVISGLPSEFSPAYVGIQYGRNVQSQRIVLSLSLSVGNSQISLPACLLRALQLGEDEEVQFSAFGEFESPPMIAITFDSGNTNSGILGHVVLLELDDLELWKIWRIRAVDSGRKIDTLELSSFCTPTEQPDGPQDDRHF